MTPRLDLDQTAGFGELALGSVGQVPYLLAYPGSLSGLLGWLLSRLAGWLNAQTALPVGPCLLWFQLTGPETAGFD